MINKLKTYFTRSEFVKNSAILVSGTAIAQILPVVISPILTRLYSPEDFGVLALFTSLSMIFSNIAAGKYELAIVLPKKDGYAINLLALSIYISAIVSFVLMVAILFFHNYFVKLLDLNRIAGWLYLLPFVVFFISGYNALTYYYVRIKNYKVQAKNKIVRSFVTSFLQLGLFFTKNGILALVGGFSAGQLSGNAAMMRGILKDKLLLRQIKNTKMIALAKRYKNFPKGTLPATLLNKASTELPNILISPFFNASFLGFYSISNRILAIPSSFIGESISQVLFQTAAEEYKKFGNSKKIFNSTLKKLFVVGVPFFALIAIFAKILFSFVFGKQWAIAGVYAQILTPLLFVRFLAGSLSSILYIFEKHKIIFTLQLTMFIISLGIFLIAHFFHFEFVTFLWYFSIILTIFYLVFLIILSLVAKAKI